MSAALQQPPPGRLARRGVVVLGIVALALLVFVSSTQTWVTVGLPQDAVLTPDLRIAGSDAATPVTAFALVALAAALAVSIAGRAARWVITVLLVLSGAGIAVTAAGVALDPASAAGPAVGAAIGVSGVEGARTDATVMPWIATLGGVLLVAAAVWVVLAGRTWRVNRKYDAGAARSSAAATGGLQPGAPLPSTGDVAPGAVPEDDGTPFDAAGSAVPDDVQGDAGRPGRRPSRRTGGSTHAREIDSWDELSRGNDPT